MWVHLRKTKGINKVLESLKKLDSDIEIKEYGGVYFDISSKKLKALIHYDYAYEKQTLWVYDVAWQKGDDDLQTEIPIRFVALFGGR